MSKSVLRAWYGHDTFGRSVEIAERADGVFFGRVLEYNGFGKGWSKWFKTKPSFTTHVINRYTDEEVELDEPRMTWGFKPMNKFVETPRYRLPKF